VYARLAESLTSGTTGEGNHLT